VKTVGGKVVRHSLA